MKTPTKIYKIHQYLFDSCGFGSVDTDEKWKRTSYKIYQNTVVFVYLFFIVLFNIDAVNVRHDREKLNLNLCVTILVTGSMIKLYDFVTKQKTVIKIRKNFESYFDLPYLGESRTDKKIRDVNAEQLITVAKGVWGVAIPTVIMWVTFPLVDPELKERKYCLPFPFFEKTTPTYEILYAFHSLMALQFVLNIISYDLVFLGSLIRFCEHCDTLSKNIYKLKILYPQEDYSKHFHGYVDYEENEEDEFEFLGKDRKSLFWKMQVQEERVAAYESSKKFINYKEWQTAETIKIMRQNIYHHQQLIKQLKDIDGVYNFTLFLQFTAGALLCSVVAFDVILQSRRLSVPVFQQFLYAFTALLDLFVISFYGTRIGEKSEQVNQALYGIPWYDMDIKCKRLFMFMITRCRKYPQIRAKYMVPVNLRTYYSLVKTVYSIMMFFNESK